LKRKTVTLIAIIVAIVISLAAYRAIAVLGSDNSSSTSHYISQPVMDVIISKLAKNANNGGTSIPLNVTVGESVNLTVSAYTESNMNLTTSFYVYSGTGLNASSWISASFNPMSFQAIANQNASTIMTLHISNSTPSGTYSAIASVEDISDPSYTSGFNFFINVKG
jgi:hypothetical protein